MSESLSRMAQEFSEKVDSDILDFMMGIEKKGEPKEIPLPALDDCAFCDGESIYYQSSSSTSGHGESSDMVGVICTQCPANMTEGHYGGYKVDERKISMADKWNSGH